MLDQTRMLHNRQDPDSTHQTRPGPDGAQHTRKVQDDAHHNRTGWGNITAVKPRAVDTTLCQGKMVQNIAEKPRAAGTRTNQIMMLYNIP